MKKLFQLSSIMFATALLSGCASSSNSVFSSLFGSNVREHSIQVKNAEAAGIVLGKTDFKPLNVSQVRNTGTFVGQKVMTFRKELSQLQNSVRRNNAELQKIRNSFINNALQYHKTVGVMETKLQVGTTPGNPIMFDLLSGAQNNVQTMNTNTASLDQLLAKISADTANTDYLVESVRSAYGISGAVDEDHRQLHILENEAEQTSILMHSLMDEVASDINRQHQYIETANVNLTGLSEAIRVGSYGGSVAAAPASSVHRAPVQNVTMPSNAKPLFAVNFSSKDVDYKEGLRQAVLSAKAKKANVVFDIVAVNPSTGSAQTYAAKIFQDIVGMGVSADKINISSRTDAKITTPSVMVFVR